MLSTRWFHTTRPNRFAHLPPTMSFKFLRFGIEAEFLLTTRSGKGYGGDLEAFAQYVCSMYQTRKEGGWPNMHVDLEGYSPGDNDNMEWSLTDDDSVAVTHDKQCK